MFPMLIFLGDTYNMALNWLLIYTYIYIYVYVYIYNINADFIHWIREDILLHANINFNKTHKNIILRSIIINISSKTEGRKYEAGDEVGKKCKKMIRINKLKLVHIK